MLVNLIFIRYFKGFWIKSWGYSRNNGSIIYMMTYLLQKLRTFMSKNDINERNYAKALSSFL